MMISGGVVVSDVVALLVVLLMMAVGRCCYFCEKRGGWVRAGSTYEEKNILHRGGGGQGGMAQKNVRVLMLLRVPRACRRRSPSARSSPRKKSILGPAVAPCLLPGADHFYPRAFCREGESLSGPFLVLLRFLFFFPK